jgi:hypothetical protein
MEKNYKDRLRSNESQPAITMTTKGRGADRKGSAMGDRWAIEPFVIAHEFLYLICNCEDRLRTIQRVHRPELVSVKGNIHHWEILNKQTGK